MSNFKKDIPAIIGLIGATSLAYISGGVINSTALSLVSSLSSNVASSFLFGISPRKIKKWFVSPHPNELNHSIRKLFVISVKEALHNINILYAETQVSKEEKRNAATITKKLQKEINSGLLDSTRIKLDEDEIKSFLNVDKVKEDEIVCYTIDFLLKEGISDSFAEFLSTHLSAQIQLCFSEGLKNPENGSAWIAFQRLLIEDIKESITNIESKQNALLDAVSDIKESTNVLSEDQVDEIRQLKELLDNKDLIKVKINNSFSDSISRIERKTNNLIATATDTNITVNDIKRISNCIKEKQKKQTRIVLFLLSVILVAVLITTFPIIRRYLSQWSLNDRASTNRIGTGEIGRDIIIDASLMDYSDVINKMTEDERYILEWSYPYFKYSDTVQNGVYSIIPQNEYFNDYYYNHHVKVQERVGYDYIFQTHGCYVDVKIVNNSNNTLVLDNIIVDIQESKLDMTPFLGIYTDMSNNSRIFFVNENEAKWDGFDFEFSILKADEKFNGTFKNKVNIPYFKERYDLDLHEYIKATGFNYDKLLKETKAEVESEDGLYYIYLDDILTDSVKKYNIFAYPFRFVPEENDEEYYEKLKANYAEYCRKHYEYLKATYDDNFEDVLDGDYDRDVLPYIRYSIKAKFVGRIKFKGYPISIDIDALIPITTNAGFGAAFDFDTTYDVKLKAEGVNYQIKHPVSLFIKPNEVERFALKLFTDKSSHHLFTIKLDNINGMNIKSSPVSIFYLQPRTFGRDSESIVLYEE